MIFIIIDRISYQPTIPSPHHSNIPVELLTAEPINSDTALGTGSFILQ